jgi:glutamate/tyrosine decarboxylase-like PLP-dependent enzyme
VLVRDPAAHVAAFRLGQTYFGDTDRGVIGAGLPFADRGVELTRGFRALKVWMSLKAHGVKAFARLIEQNVAQAQHLAGLIESQPEMEILAPVALNVVCFRYRPRGCPPERLNSVNQEILLRVQESGIAVVSSTVLEGRFALRAAITNHRSRREDFDIFVQALTEIGEHVADELLR